MKKIIQFNKIESTARFNLHGNYVIVCFFIQPTVLPKMILVLLLL